MPRPRPTDYGQPADPAGMAGLDVACDLGHPRQRPDGLQVGGADPGVAPEGDLGDQQRPDEDRQLRQDPSSLALKTVMMTEAPDRQAERATAAASRRSMATENLAPTSSARISAADDGVDQPAETDQQRHDRERELPRPIHECPSDTSGPEDERDARHRHERAHMPVTPAGRPAAMCGSAPTVMPTAATAMTSRARLCDRAVPAAAPAAARRTSRRPWRWAPPRGRPAARASAARRTR